MVLYTHNANCPKRVSILSSWGTYWCLLGASASGVPGEVRGFYTAWKKYGKLPWKDLVQPTIELAAEGFQLGNAAHYALTRKSVQPLLMKDPGMRFVFFWIAIIKCNLEKEDRVMVCNEENRKNETQKVSLKYWFQHSQCVKLRTQTAIDHWLSRFYNTWFRVIASIFLVTGIHTPNCWSSLIN
mgnify:CR=1 FL=1